MRTPEFWCQDGARARLLAPASWLYDAGRRLARLAARAERAERPVICVGNLVAGGAGKTPAAMAIAQRLKALGRTPHLLSRGYAGRERGPLRVDPSRHDARAVGDEALLLARIAPTWIGYDRAASARLAIAAGADCLVLDDGFQNPHLVKDLSLVVVDAYGFGNGRLLPAGPLREPVAAGLGRADALILVESPLAPLDAPPTDLQYGYDGPVLSARLVPTPETAPAAGSRAVAFAGIARPEKFFESLQALGIEVLAAHRFGDHHRYNAAEIMNLVEAASAKGARLITTAKDHVRLPVEAQSMAEVLEVELVFREPAAIDVLLADAVADA